MTSMRLRWASPVASFVCVFGGLRVSLVAVYWWSNGRDL
ncbi:hypothetical protein BVRB_9g212170 [Beta vulgaris subsp. vulgaris]|nr:hypothetical protein BVRB_9g212170 [Beta vulgaris subsp. vulgaris]